MERYLRAEHPAVSERIQALRLETEREFGAMSAALNRVVGPLLLWSSRGYSRRHPLDAGWSRVLSSNAGCRGHAKIGRLQPESEGLNRVQ